MSKKKTPKDARIDGGDEDKEAKPKKEPKERKPRLQLTGENSKVRDGGLCVPLTIAEHCLRCQPSLHRG